MNSFLFEKLIERLEAISQMEPPDYWKPGETLYMSYEMLMVIKEACGMAAYELKKRKEGTP